MKKLSFCLLALLVGCAAPKKDDYVAYVSSNKAKQQLSAPLNAMIIHDQIEIRGEYEAADAFTMNGPLYAGDAGLVGVLAQVAVHAAISNDAQNSRLSAQQQEANKVLEPLTEILSSLSAKQLHHANKNVLWLSTDEQYTGPVLKSKPIFFLSQDARTLSLKHVVAVEPEIKKSNSKKQQKLYANLIEVVAQPAPAEAAMEYWLNNNGAALSATMQQLYRQSVSLALADIKGELIHTEKAETFKLEHQDTLRIERGNRIKGECNQLILRNLRGWIVVLPSQQPADSNATICPLS